MLLTAALTLTLACRAPYEEAVDNSLQAVDSGCSGEPEVPYDGIDQDCDGADLLDADGDGFNIGDDCDDVSTSVYPGASEVPYDGVDQDCDGLDLCDADGDLLESTICGGTDCDDSDHAVFPGANEVLANGADDDCDARLDEVEVCPDGARHFLTLQDAVDAAPDGGVIAICAGVWTESVVLHDRSLTLVGAGEMPEDTVIEAGEGYGLEVAGASADLTLTWLGLRATTVETYLVHATDGALVTLSQVDLSDGGVGTAGSIGAGYYDVPSSRISIALSRIIGEFSLVSTLDLDISTSSINAQLANRRAGSSSSDYCRSVACMSRARVSNCLLLGGSVSLWSPEIWTGGADILYEPLTFEHNTILSSTSLDILSVEWRGYADDPEPMIGPGVFRNNIIAGTATMSADHRVETSSIPCSDLVPDDSALGFETNLHAPPFGVLSMEATEYSCNCWYGGYIEYYERYCGQEEENPDVRASDWYWSLYAASSTEADPLFTYNPQMGSYALGAASPGIDAGSGDSDPDGSPPDIGAFGGPHGDWYREYPWALE